MDRLQELFEKQQEFEEQYFRRSKGVSLEEFMKSEQNKLSWNKEFILCLMKESSELLDNLNWKHHTDQNVAELSENFLENAVDVVKYLFAILVANGFNAEDFYEKFLAKTLVVKAKFEQKILLKDLEKHPERKIAIVDIDGVLSDYPNRFLEFARNCIDVDKQATINLPTFRDHDYALYRKVKEAYRISGVKARMPLKPGADRFIQHLRKQNYFIILLTARPYNKIFSIYQDTINWLNSNKLLYDAIIWEKDKAKYVVEHLKDKNVVFCVDDEISQAGELARVFPTFLVSNTLLYRSIEDEVGEFNAIATHKAVSKDSSVNSVTCCCSLFDVLNEVKKLEKEMKQNASTNYMSIRVPRS